MKAKEYANVYISRYRKSKLPGEQASRATTASVFEDFYNEFYDMCYKRNCSSAGCYGTLMEFDRKWKTMCGLIKNVICIDIPTDLFTNTIVNNAMYGSDSITRHDLKLGES